MIAGRREAGASLPCMELDRTRLRDLLGDQDPTDVLRATPARLEAWACDNDTDWDALWRPGGWTARAIVAHLCDQEIGFAFRARNVVTAAHPPHVVQAYDPDAWSADYPRMDPALATEAFRGLRAWNLAWLARRDLQDWLRPYRHPEWAGEETLDEMVRDLAGHDLHHLNQLALTQGQAGPAGAPPA